jgi:hypothetical protein
MAGIATSVADKDSGVRNALKQTINKTINRASEYFR